MTTKSKFQISSTLESRVKQVLITPNTFDIDLTCLEVAYVLGFHYANVTNYVGLTTDYKLFDSALSVVGVCFLHSPPDEQQIKAILSPIKDHYRSLVGDFTKFDKNNNVYLVYHKDQTSDQVIRKLYNINDENYLLEQPPLTVLDETKIYMHSTLVSIEANLKLDLYDDEKRLQSQEKIDSSIKKASDLLSSNVTLHLKKSNYSSKTPLDDKSILESLYNCLDIPKEVEQMGDYLPQMTKEEKKKQQSKWRNKIKDQRAPLSFLLEREGVTVSDADNAPENYHIKLEEYLYLQVNDPMSKCTKQIIHLLRQKLELIRLAISFQHQDDRTISTDEVRSCTFKPNKLGHLVQAAYLIATERNPRFDQLRSARLKLHEVYLLPPTEPSFRYSQRISNLDMKNQDQINGYLCNVHKDIAEKSGVKGATLHELVEGKYTFHHYMQDRISDNGWGCAYRSLQTIVSWFKHQGYIYSPDVEPVTVKSCSSELHKRLWAEKRVPTHNEIQQALIEVGDKQPSFLGSQKWIGSQEVCFVLDHLYNISSKFISVSSGSELAYKARDLGQHFATQRTPIMIGGGVLAHTIIGIDFNEKNGDIGYLILDPHYTGAEDLSVINKKGWCGWKKNSFWDKGAFYNLCLPQCPTCF